jgi:hypothetical protein
MPSKSPKSSPTSSSKSSSTSSNKSSATSSSKSSADSSAKRISNLLQHRLLNIEYVNIEADRKLQQNMKNISNYVILDKTPHFPIISKKDNTILQEKNDGNFESFILENQSSYELLKNMLQQIVVSILSLHHFGVRKSNFNNLDLKEITYIKTESSETGKEKFIHYKIHQKDCYIKDCGFLWIFSSINEIEDNNYNKSSSYITNKHKYEEDEEESFEDEYTNLFHFILQNKKIKNQKFKNLIKSLQELMIDEPIDTMNKETNFFELVSPILFNSTVDKDAYISNKGNTYVIHKSKLTFSQ